jgi:hypothetical protein
MSAALANEAVCPTPARTPHSPYRLVAGCTCTRTYDAPKEADVVEHDDAVAKRATVAKCEAVAEAISPQIRAVSPQVCQRESAIESVEREMMALEAVEGEVRATTEVSKVHPTGMEAAHVAAHHHVTPGETVTAEVTPKMTAAELASAHAVATASEGEAG